MLRRLKEMEEAYNREKKLRLEAEEESKMNKKLRLEAEEKSRINEKLRIEAEEKLSLLQIKCMKSRSYPDVFEEYLQSSTLTNVYNLGLPEVDHEKIISAWNTIVANLHILGEGTNEKGQVHPFIKFTLETIKQSFDLSNINFHLDKRLRNPNLSPDFIISSSNIAQPSWLDCLSFLECKAVGTPESEGGGQSISYMVNLLFPNNDDLNFSQIPNYTFVSSTTGRSIQFFIMEKLKKQFKKYYTSNLNLFHTECELGAPADGFKLLCVILCFLAKSKKSLDKLEINGTEYDILETFQKSEPIVVGLIYVNQDEGMCVAKCSLNKNKNGLFLIRKEAQFYKILKNSNVKTLQLSSISSANNLVFKDVGLCDLKSWCNDLLYSNSELSLDEKFKQFVICFVKVFDEIEKLHQFGYTHSDIRPANVLILEDNCPCLIDFVTATPHGTTLDWLQGTLFYMAEGLLRTETPFRYMKKYDLESFCYSFLDCADKHFSNSFLRPEESDLIGLNSFANNDNIKFADLRQKALNRLGKYHQFGPDNHFLEERYVSLFFSLLGKLNTVIDGEDLNENDYADLRNILESSIASL